MFVRCSSRSAPVPGSSDCGASQCRSSQASVSQASASQGSASQGRSPQAGLPDGAIRPSRRPAVPIGGAGRVVCISAAAPAGRGGESGPVARAVRIRSGRSRWWTRENPLFPDHRGVGFVQFRARLEPEADSALDSAPESGSRIRVDVDPARSTTLEDARTIESDPSDRIDEVRGPDFGGAKFYIAGLRFKATRSNELWRRVANRLEFRGSPGRPWSPGPRPDPSGSGR